MFYQQWWRSLLTLAPILIFDTNKCTTNTEKKEAIEFVVKLPGLARVVQILVLKKIKGCIFITPRYWNFTGSWNWNSPQERHEHPYWILKIPEMSCLLMTRSCKEPEHQHLWYLFSMTGHLCSCYNIQTGYRISFMQIRSFLGLIFFQINISQFWGLLVMIGPQVRINGNGINNPQFSLEMRNLKFGVFFENSQTFAKSYVVFIYYSIENPWKQLLANKYGYVSCPHLKQFRFPLCNVNFSHFKLT